MAGVIARNVTSWCLLPDRAAHRIEHRPMIRFDHDDDRLHERRRREELAAVVSFLNRELREEVFVKLMSCVLTTRA